MPPRRATTLRAPCALDGAASRLHVPSAFATVGALERCPSGRRGTPGERVYPQGTEGSNPSLSACQTHLGARPLLACASHTLRCSDAPRPRRLAWRLSAPASLSSGGPSAARVRFAHAALLRCPQTPSAGVAPLGASLPFIWGPVQCSPRFARLRTNPRAASAARRRPRRLAWHLSAPGSLCLAPPVQGGYCTTCPAGVGRWRLGPAQEGVANSVRSGRKQRYRMSSCAAGRPSRYRRTPRTSTQ